MINITQNKYFQYLLANKFFYLLILGVCLFKWDQLYYTIFWDEPTYAFQILTQDFRIFLPSSNESYSFTPHIFGFSLLLYIGKIFFLGGLFSLKFLMLLNFILLLFGIKKIFQLYNSNDRQITLSILNIFLIPIFIPFSTMVQPDLVVLNLGVWIFYFYISQQFKKFLWFSFFSSFVFETVIAFTLPIILYESFKALRNKSSIKFSLITLLTSLPLFSYLIYRKFQNGLFLYHNTILEKNSVGIFEWTEITSHKMIVFKEMMQALFFNVGPYLCLFIILIKLLPLKKEAKHLLYTLFVSLLFIGFWFFFGEYHARNLISAYGFIAISISILILKLPRIQSSACALLITAGLIFSSCYPKKRESPDSYFSTYTSGHEILLRTLNFIYTQNNRKILTYWPLRVNINEHAHIFNVPYNHHVVDVLERDLNPKYDIVRINLIYDQDEDVTLRDFIKLHKYKIIFNEKVGPFTARYYQSLLHD